MVILFKRRHGHLPVQRRFIRLNIAVHIDCCGSCGSVDPFIFYSNIHVCRTRFPPLRRVAAPQLRLVGQYARSHRIKALNRMQQLFKQAIFRWRCGLFGIFIRSIILIAQLLRRTDHQHLPRAGHRHIAFIEMLLFVQSPRYLAPLAAPRADALARAHPRHMCGCRIIRMPVNQPVVRRRALRRGFHINQKDDGRFQTFGRMYGQNPHCITHPERLAFRLSILRTRLRAFERV